MFFAMFVEVVYILFSVCLGVRHELPRSVALSEFTLIVVGLRLQFFSKFGDESKGGKLHFSLEIVAACFKFLSLKLRLIFFRDFSIYSVWVLKMILVVCNLSCVLSPTSFSNALFKNLEKKFFKSQNLN